MIRFIHTADWQIGMKAAHVGAAGETVRAERLRSAQRVVDAAIEQKVDFVVIAGDTFEHNAVDRVLVQKVADIVGKLNCPAYLIPGNHDPLVAGSVWQHPAWKSHAHVRVISEAAPVELAGVTLYPCPLREKYSLKDPTRWIDARQCTGVAVGIAHGTVEGVTIAEVDYPISREAASRAGLDYLALGHWHSTATYAETRGAVRMAYSGTHETTKFGERDSGNVLLVEIQERGATPTITPIRTGGLRWELIEQEIRDAGDLQRLREGVESTPDGDRTLLDVRLSGILTPEDSAELNRLDEIVKARFLYCRIDAARLAPSPEDDRWLSELPVGVIRDVASELQALSRTEAAVPRPENAAPEVASHALLELYRLVQEVRT